MWFLGSCCLEVWDTGGKKKIRGIYHHVAPQFLNILYFGYSLSVIISFLFLCVQTPLSLCNLMYCSPPGSSVHGIF